MRAQSHSHAGPGPSSTAAALPPISRQHRGAPGPHVLTRDAHTSRHAWIRPGTASIAAHASSVIVSAAETPQPASVSSSPVAASPYDTSPPQSDTLAHSLGISEESVARLLLRHSVPQGVTGDELSTSTLSLSAQLRLDPLKTLSMVLKRPSLIYENPLDVQAAVSAIARAAGMDAFDLAPLVAAQPALLSYPMSDLAADLSRLATSLEVTQAALMLILSRCSTPALQQLLGSPLPAVRQQLSELRTMLYNRLGGGRGPGIVSIAQLLVTRCPYLLLTPVSQVESSLDMVTRLLQLTKRKMSQVFGKVPALLCMPAAQLLENYKGLLSALQINQGAVADMVIREPRLLQLDPQKVKSRVDGLLFSLYIPRKQVLDMLVSQPQLLLYHTETLSSHMAALMDLLALQHEVVVAVIQHHPIMLMVSRQLLQAKLSLLSDLFLLPPMHARELITLQPRIVSFSSVRLHRTREVLRTTLGLNNINVAATVFTYPELLVVPPGTLVGKVRDLSALLGIEEPEAGKLLRANTQFLVQPAQLWQSNIDTLASVLGISLEQIRSAAMAQPKILSQDAKQLLSRCQQLARLLRPPRQATPKPVLANARWSQPTAADNPAAGVTATSVQPPAASQDGTSQQTPGSSRVDNSGVQNRSASAQAQAATATDTTPATAGTDSSVASTTSAASNSSADGSAHAAVDTDVTTPQVSPANSSPARGRRRSVSPAAQPATWQAALENATGVQLVRLLVGDGSYLEHLEYLVSQGQRDKYNFMSDTLYDTVKFQRSQRGFAAWRRSRPGTAAAGAYGVQGTGAGARVGDSRVQIPGTRAQREAAGWLSESEDEWAESAELGDGTVGWDGVVGPRRSSPGRDFALAAQSDGASGASGEGASAGIASAATAGASKQAKGRGQRKSKDSTKSAAGSAGRNAKVDPSTVGVSGGDDEDALVAQLLDRFASTSDQA